MPDASLLYGEGSRGNDVSALHECIGLPGRNMT